MIDLTIGWFGVCQYDEKSITVTNIIEQEWLYRYPLSSQITIDRGYEFIEQEFEYMIKNDFGIEPKIFTTRNLQANTTVERTHQVLANMTRTFELKNKFLISNNPWKRILSVVSFAMRSTISTTTWSTPV